MAVVYDTCEDAAVAFNVDLNEHPLDEPDEFHLAGGFVGKIDRNDVTKAYLCYVKAPEGTIIPDINYHVHGGITYHEPNKIGFDFMHAHDYYPSILARPHAVSVWTYATVKMAMYRLHGDIIDTLLPPQEGT